MSEPFEASYTPGRGYTLELSQPFVDGLRPEQVDAYVAAVVEAADLVQNAENGDGADDDLAALLQERLDEAGVIVHDRSLLRLTEQLQVARGVLTIMTSYGTVLHRDPRVPIAWPDADGFGPPEHPGVD